MRRSIAFRPRVLPWSLAPSGVLGRGGPVPVPPYLALGCAPPSGRVRRVRVPGSGLGGGGGGPCAVPPVCAAGGASRAGGRSASFRPSAWPGQAPKRVSLVSFWSWGAWPPYRSGSCSSAFSGRDLCGVLARWREPACSLRFLWEPAAAAGCWAVLRLLSRAGGGGTIPPASGRWGPAPPRLAGRWWGWGGGGRAAASLLPLWGAARGSLPWPPSCRRRTPPRRARSVGVTGPPRGGGDEVRSVDRFPGGPFRLLPSLCPPRVGNGHGGGHAGRGPHTVLVHRRGPHPRAGVGSTAGRDLRGGRRPGGLGRALCRSSRTPPPPRVAVPSRGGGAFARLRGGGGSLLWPSSFRGERGGGSGGPLRRPRPTRPVGRRPAICCLRRPPPGVYSCCGGCRAAVGVGRGPISRQWVSAAGGGGRGGNPPALVRALALPRTAFEGAAPFAPSWAPPVRRRSAAGRAGACGRFTGGACRGRGAPSPRVQRPLVPWRRLLTAEGGGLAVPVRGPAVGWGVTLFPRPPPPRAGASCKPWLGSLVPPCRRRAALGGRGHP